MTEEKPKVKLVTQSYSEFAYGGLEEKLEFVGMVSAFAGNNYNTYQGMKISLDADLINEAKKLDAQYVFSIKYQFGLPSKPNSAGFVYGDAYKVVEKDKTPFRG